jgi:hypothetical protein
LLGVAAVLGELLRDHLREGDVKEHACAKNSKIISIDDMMTLASGREI